MVNACVLIKAVPPKAKDVLKGVKRFKEVKSAFLVFGRYDIAVFVEAPDHNAVTRLSMKINALKGVRRTETLVEGQS